MSGSQAAGQQGPQPQSHLLDLLDVSLASPAPAPHRDPWAAPELPHRPVCNITTIAVIQVIQVITN